MAQDTAREEAMAKLRAGQSALAYAFERANKARCTPTYRAMTP